MSLYNQKTISEMGRISDEVYDNDPSGVKYFKDNPEEMLIDTAFGITSYTVIDYTSTSTDMQALLLAQNDSTGNPTGEYVIAFRGTSGAFDIGIDAIIGLANYNPQFNDAKDFVQSVLDNPEYNITAENLTLTGHSLGGILTQSVGAVMGIKGYAFNPYGTERLLTMWSNYSGTFAESLINVGVYQVLNAFGLESSYAAFAQENILNISYSDLGSLNGDPLSNFASALSSDHLGAYLPMFGDNVGDAGHKIGVLNQAISHYNNILGHFTEETTYGDLSIAYALTGDDGFNRVNATFDELKISQTAENSLQFNFLNETSSTDLQNQASNSATLYALLKLNPFVITGVDYSTYNQNGKLDIDNYSDQFIEDRAKFLYQLTHTAAPSDSDTHINFKDLALGITTETLDTYDEWGTINGTSDYIFGTNYDDSIDSESWGSADHLYGMGGNDSISGGLGDDYIEGGKGQDTLNGDSGNDTFVVIGTDNDYDIFNGGTGDEDTILGGAGDDTIRVHRFSAANSIEKIDGGEGNDTIAGTDMADTIDLSETLVEGIEQIDTGAGNDTIIGSKGADHLIGGTDNDILVGGQGTDTLEGGAGNDTYIYKPGDGNDSIIDSDGIGKILLTDANGIATEAATGNFTQTELGSDQWTSSSGNVTLTQGESWVLSFADGGTINLGANFTSGYLGINLVDAASPPSAVIPRGDEQANFLYDSTIGQKIHAQAGKDMVFGSSGDDILDGGTGDDWIAGRGGADTIEGGAGDDLISWIGGGSQVNAGEGNDVVVANAREWFYVDQPKGDITTDAIWADVSQYWQPGHADGPSIGDNGYLAANFWGGVSSGSYSGDSVLGDGWTYEFSIGADSSFDITYYHPTKAPDGMAPARYWEHTVQPADSDSQGVTLYGEGGDDLLAGHTGDDYLSGGADRDILFGNGGDDVLDGGAAADILAGGAGADILLGGGGNDEIHGESETDIIFGGAGDDLIWADSQSEQLGIRDGNDYAEGGAGNDQILGQGGDDTLLGDSGQDLLIGGAGDDVLSGGTEADYLYGDNHPSETLSAELHGDDQLSGGAGADVLFGGGGSDVLRGDEDDDSLTGGAGNDKLYGGSGDDTLVGDASPTQLTANLHGDDELHGGEGSDLLFGAGGSDHLYGDAGDDKLYGDGSDIDEAYQGDDTLDGGNGDDLLSGGGGNDHLQGGDGIDSLYGGRGSDLLEGGLGADTLYGNAGDDYLYGDAGDDFLVGSGGDDQLAGGDGNDSLYGDAIGETGNDTLEGGAGDDFLYADTGNDQLSGGIGNDILYGGAGNDHLLGGAGDDLLIAGTGEDVVEGGDGHDTYVYESGSGRLSILDVGSNTLRFGANISSDSLSLGLGSLLIRTGVEGDEIHIENFNPDDVYSQYAIDRFEFADGTVLSYEELLARGFDLNGTAGNDIITGTSVDDRLQGFAGDDTIIAKTGNDLLDGGSGADVMRGNQGDDIYLVDDVGDQVEELVDEGTDEVRSSLDYALGNNVENLTLTGSATLETGNELNNQLIGNASDNRLEGLAGDDMLDGQDGADQLFGGAGDDVLRGRVGNDLLDGGSGSDSLYGGSGDDSYRVDDYGDRVFEGDNQGRDRVESLVSYQLDAYVEDLQLSGTQDLNGAGNTGDNLIFGNAGNNQLFGLSGNDRLEGGAGDDTLDGGIGDDTLLGGEGNDTYRLGGYSGINDVVVEQVGQGIDTVESEDSYTLGDNVENLTLLDKDNLYFTVSNGTGNALDNHIKGNYISNLLDGGGGADVLEGGAGNDSYIVDNRGDQIIEEVNNGLDQVRSSVSYALTENVEDLTLTGNAAIDGSGNLLSNNIIGNAADNLLSGGGGSDYLSGGDGQDQLFGEDGNDSIYGRNGNDELFGGEGADSLLGGAGEDLMTGGRGNDHYYVDNEADQVVENADEGIDEVFSSVDYTLAPELENLTLIGNANIAGTGNEVDNKITGNRSDNVLSGGGGDDYLDGGYGSDTMIGGTGNDLYWINSTNDLIVEAASQGYDRVNSWVSYTLSENIEQLNLVGSSAINGTGNIQDDLIVGNDDDNILDGLAGNDNLDGGSGDDTLLGGDGDDILYGGAGDVSGGNEGLVGVNTFAVQSMVIIDPGGSGEALSNNDYLDGGAGNDSLDGGSGNDSLQGGTGRDTLYGGSGDDMLDGGSGIDLLAGGSGNDIYYVDGYTETSVIPGDGDGGGDPVPVCLPLDGPTITIGKGKNRQKGNEGVGNGSDPPPPGHDQNYNDGPGTSPGNPGNKGDSKAGQTSGPALIPVSTPTNEEQAVLPGSTDPLPQTQNISLDSAPEDQILTTYITDTVNENADAGYDVVYSSITYALTDHVEELHLIGSDNLGGSGNDLNNLIVGNSGDNQLDGGVGNDQLIGGMGNDRYVVDSLADSLVENPGGGYDRVASVIDYTLKDNFEALSLLGGENIQGTGNADDNDLRGNRGDNLLQGLPGNDTLAGGAGNDTLEGGAGNDSYLFSRGDGLDLIRDSQGVNLIRFGADISQDQVVVRLTERDGLTITQIRLRDVYGSELDQGFDVEMPAGAAPLPLEFADGSSATSDELLATATTFSGSKKQDLIVTGDADDTVFAGAGNDRVCAGRGNDLLYGEAGDDELHGGAGHDQLIGGAGADILYGECGNDQLTGGSGNDWLGGAQGDDSYLFTAGDGSDTINNYDPTGFDRILFGEAVDPARIALFHNGTQLEIGYGKNDQITVNDFFVGSDNQIDDIQLADGRCLMTADIDAIVQQMSAYAIQEGISLNSLTDVRQDENLMTLVAGSWHAA